MSKVLVTGGSGFIGSYICRELISRSFTPVIFDAFISHVTPDKKRLNIPFKERFRGIENKVIIERGFTNHYEVCLSVLEKHMPSYIIHLAALPLAKLPNLNMQEAMEGALTSTSNLLCSSHKIHLPLKRFIYTSSSMVYGNFKTDIVDETFPTKPIEIYGTVKLAGEEITRGLGRHFKIPFTILRPSAVYGPLDNNKRVTQIFIENALHGDKLKVQGADEKLDFSYIKDVAKGFVDSMLSDNSVNETYNLTGGNGRTLLEYANIVKKYFKDAEIEVVQRDDFRPRRGTLDISKAKNDFAYNPEYMIEDGIKEYAEFMRGRKN